MFIDEANLSRALRTFPDGKPFHHCVVDDFLLPDVASQLSKEFPAYNDSSWFVYDSPLERKKALNNWNQFPPTTYKLFEYLTSENFVKELSEALSLNLLPDPGLHGGGWHIHGAGGNLNPHLDYSLHPKCGLMQKINIIVYMSEDLRLEHGGHLGFWDNSGEGGGPGVLRQEIEPRYNRAVIFDTTQDSWHGISRPLNVPNNIFRKSLAIYYLTNPTNNCDSRSRALFAPRDYQLGDRAVMDIIEKRSDELRAKDVYRVLGDRTGDL